MKISQVEIKQFKRFTNLRVFGIPETVKLVVTVGPNGSGKSSLFDAFNVFLARTKGSSSFDKDYHAKVAPTPAEEGQDIPPQFASPADWSALINNLNIWFHDVPDYDRMNPDPSYRKAFYIRSGYRNEADFSMSSLNRRSDMLQDENRPQLLISPDSRVSDNYQRIVSAAVADIFSEAGADSITKAQLRDRLIGEARDSLLRVLPQLRLTGVGDPLGEGTFLFRKGTSNDWRYKNLSGGEKAAFDLILDFVVKKEKFDNTVFCIDEPETHMNTAVQAGLLEELYGKLPDACQLWISTHSIGMMRAAKDLAERYPGTVAFLDFDGHDFDRPVEIQPAVTDRAFWKKTFAVAIGDLADLVAPRQIVFCEGSRVGRRNAKFDQRCLSAVFAREYPDVEFVSVGGTSEIEANAILVSSVLADVLSGIAFSRVIDLDDRSPEEVSELKEQGTNVLSRRDIESYLYDDEVVTALYARNEQPAKLSSALQEKTRLLTESTAARGNPADDVKSISGQFYNYLKRDLALTQCGNTSEAFAISTLVPLIQSGMTVYEQLRRDVFGLRDLCLP